MEVRARGAILCADPDRASRREITLLLSGLGRQIEVSENGEGALACLERLHPSLLLIAADLHQPCCFEVLHRIRLLYGRSPMIAIVAASHDPTPRDEVAALLLGADEYFTRPLQPDSVIVRTRRLLDDPQHASERRAARERADLTPREREVLALLIDGQRTEEIAGRLCITRKTAATHIERILGKLGAHNRAHAVALALRDRKQEAD